MKDGLHSSWLPSYGPEMRAGTAQCDVILSRGEIGSPMVDQPDVLIAMNTPSLLRFQSRLKPDGLIIYDSSLVTESPETPYADCLSAKASRLSRRSLSLLTISSMARWTAAGVRNGTFFISAPRMIRLAVFGSPSSLAIWLAGAWAQLRVVLVVDFEL
jgi:Pyruvate ferredoxin/flavodoxin oxidoreductase